MDLGLLCEFDVPQPWDYPHPWGQRFAERLSYRNSIEQVVLADKLGFRTAWLVEHHFREGRSHLPCNEVVLGALSQITQQIRLGFGVTLMPHDFLYPARVAEKVATVDLLSSGRVEWGMGRSGAMEQVSFGVDTEKSMAQLLAAARSVVGMWREEYFEEDSEFLKFPRRLVTPRPFQDPHPPAWLAASSVDSVRMAGRLALGLLCFTIQHPIDELSELVEIYRSAQQSALPLTDVTTNRVGAYTLVYCSNDFSDGAVEQLVDAIDWRFSGVAQFALKWDYPNMSPQNQAIALPRLTAMAEGRFDLESLDRDGMIIVGTPEECFQKLSRLRSIGIDEVLCYVGFGHLPQHAVMESIRLLGEEVLPKLRDT